MRQYNRDRGLSNVVCVRACECVTVALQMYRRVVAESCEVALDISDYWTDDTQFQYADVEGLGPKVEEVAVS